MELSKIGFLKGKWDFIKSKNFTYYIALQGIFEFEIHLLSSYYVLDLI